MNLIPLNFITQGEQTPLRRMMLERALAGGGALSEYEITGNPVAFNTNLARPLSAFTIPFLPVQSGTGDPSPSNVRPISGWTGVTAYHGADQTDYDSYPVTFPDGQTVYGGTLDAVNGVLTVEWVGKSALWGDIKTGEPHPTSGNTVGYLVYENPVVISGGGASGNNSFCNVAKYVWDGIAYAEPHFYIGTTGGGSIYRAAVYLPSETDDNTLVVCVCKLVTPIEIPLSDIPVPVTLIGDNTIWTDTNGENTVKYLKKG